MKKTLSIMLVVAMVLGAALAANAATTVQVTLTSPVITKGVGACEKAGAVTFSFPKGAVIAAGDWWYMDLPEGATLCKDIDYLVIGNASTFVANRWVATDNATPTTVVFNNIADTLASIGAGAATTGVVQVTPAATTTVVGNMALRVIGQSGTRRVSLYAASQGLTAAGTAATITVGGTNDTDSMLIKILDGVAQSELVATAASRSRIITDLNKTTFTGPVVAGVLTVNTAGTWRVFGQHTGDTVPGGASNAKNSEYVGVLGGQVPFVENTLCVSAATATGNLHVSFASKDDKFTFSGDSQIAHTGTVAAISLLACTAKTGTTDEIRIATQDACWFDYETVGAPTTGNNYCTTHLANAALYLASSTTFGELDDKYDVIAESLTPNVYFQGMFGINGVTASTAVCDAGVGTALAFASTDYCSGTTCKSAGGDIDYAPNTKCAVADKNKIDKIRTTGGSITGVHTYKYLKFNFANFVYKNANVSANTEVKLKITLEKYPCGQIFTDTFTIGKFVTACSTTATGTTTIFFPYLAGTKYAGWFNGLVISNNSATAGTAKLTAVDVNGNKGTYTTASIPAYGQFNASFLTASDWGQDAANTANFDMSENFTVSVTCNFTGAGFAFIGNTVEGYAVGYALP